jgi:hypothetical protein
MRDSTKESSNKTKESSTKTVRKMGLTAVVETVGRPYGPELSPAVLRLTFVASISEVSRFPRMKFLGVPGASDCARPTRARSIAIVRVAFPTC